jgi:hypothetical protein
MLFAAFRRQPFYPERMAASINNSAWLEWVAGLTGGVSRQTRTATFSPDRFYCLLEELPLHLLPMPARKSLQCSQVETRRLVLNPQCQLFNGDRLPSELDLRRELLSGLALQGTISWVRDPNRGYTPFWLGPRLERIVHELNANAPVTASVPASVGRVLQAANILVPEEAMDAHAEQRSEAIAKAAAQFGEKGYAPLRDLIHPFHIAALRRYCRHKIRVGAIPLGDRQSSRRYAIHNDPVAHFFHHQIAATLSQVAGQPLKPSYVYLASYLSGAALKKHTDREQCEFSITLCLDYSPEPALATPWPIHLETPTGTVTVYQALGDGLAYRGTQLPHYRGRLHEGATSTSIFFHYVAADFLGSLN